MELEPHRVWVRKRLAEKGSTIPTKFIQTAPPYEPNKPGGRVGKSSGISLSTHSLSHKRTHVYINAYMRTYIYANKQF